MRTVAVGNLAVGDGQPLVLIAGPCVIEHEELTRAIALCLRNLAREMGIPFIFKASYDKANRTSSAAYRGPGFEQGIEILKNIKQDLNIPVLSDVHRYEEIEKAAEILDVIQIPAFLCRQTDLIVEVAERARVVNIKKGQFLAPWDVRNILEKVLSRGNDNILITERGTCFGYNNLVVDFRSLPILRREGFPVVFDATHSVQLPGGQGTASGGQREMVPYLARAAAAVGIDGLFLEVHLDPSKALCDGPNSLYLDTLPELLRTVKAIDRSVMALKSQSP
ncbi:MAG: 3-deoxy-8-phosphooctulonate synthase [Syntrophus sp. (in: bacteria)]|nr:3-deoxy-8-phosphooctulonate synthase [Syntrophus sp. (in: bacteria)]